MRMKLLRGRDFAESDVPASQLVVVVNRELAEKEWPGADPLGERMRPVGMDSPDVEPWATVIGVVDNVPGSTALERAPESYYYSYRQLPFRSRWMTAVVRSPLPPASLTTAVRAAIARVDPSAPVEFRS